MKLGIVVWIIFKASTCEGREDHVLTPARRHAHNNVGKIAKYGDAQHRGDKFYTYTSVSTNSAAPESLESSQEGLPSITEEEGRSSKSESSDASSIITTEQKHEKKIYRKCTPCTYDMLKQFENRGIKWICGMYQRARRTFKSECMMRYRNCQDGTMFVKMHDHRCKGDKFHGHHWFYMYKV